MPAHDKLLHRAGMLTILQSQIKCKCKCWCHLQVIICFSSVSHKEDELSWNRKHEKYSNNYTKLKISLYCIFNISWFNGDRKHVFKKEKLKTKEKTRLLGAFQRLRLSVFCLKSWKKIYSLALAVIIHFFYYFIEWNEITQKIFLLKFWKPSDYKLSRSRADEESASNTQVVIQIYSFNIDKSP